MFVALLLLAAVQSAAGPDPAAAVAQKPPPAADPVADAFICRMEVVTGTRFPQKVCRRKSEFAQKAADDQLRLRQQQRPQYSCKMSNLPC